MLMLFAAGTDIASSSPLRSKIVPRSAGTSRERVHCLAPSVAERVALARLQDADLEQHERQHEHERDEQHDQPLARLAGPEPELARLRVLRRDDATRGAPRRGAAEQRAGAGPGGAPRGACSEQGRGDAPMARPAPIAAARRGGGVRDARPDRGRRRDGRAAAVVVRRLMALRRTPP